MRKKHVLIALFTVCWLVVLLSPYTFHARANRSVVSRQTGWQSVPGQIDQRNEAPRDIARSTDPVDAPASELGLDRSLYRPPAGLSTSHYNFSATVMSPEFLDHLQHATKRIHANWKSKGWARFDKRDTTDCDIVTPECSLFQNILPPASDKELRRRAYTKCCVEHKLLAEVALWTIKRLTKANITYFLSTGTALGAVRHNGTIIPWDTDIDLAIFPRDRDRVEALFRDNGERYFHVDQLGKPMFWIHHSKNGKPRDGPHVEIFFDAVYTKYPEHLLPLMPCVLYHHVVNCPNERMFTIWFPSGWRTYGGGHYHGDHRCTIYKNGKRYEVDKC